MLSITHGLTGAFIASHLANPLYSFPTIITVHYLQDLIPHWDLGTGLTKHLKTKKLAFFQELLIDFPLSALFVYFIFRQYQTFSIYPWLGWFFGLLPDFIEFPYLFLNWRFFPITHLARLHAFTHRSTNHKIIGLLPQFAIIIAIYYLN